MSAGDCFARAPVASSSLAARRSAFRSSTPDAMAFASTRAIALETPPRARLASRRGDVAGVRRVVMHRAEGRHRSAGGASSLRERRPSSRHRHRQRVVVVAAAAADDDDSNKGLGLLEWLGPVIPQGALVTGVKGGWKLAWRTMMTELAPSDDAGAYVRPSYGFDDTLSNDPTAKHPAMCGRYVVYVGNACPWCHRVTLTIALKGLSDAIAVVKMTDDAERASRGGWVFEQFPASARDPVFGARDLREVYDAAVMSKGPAGAPYRGRCTAPLLLDAARKTPVCNESADIVRALNDVDFVGVVQGVGQGVGQSDAEEGVVELRPAALLDEIDAWGEEVYRGLNNGVYRCGFATSQAAYERAATDVKTTLLKVEKRLSESRFLCGDKITEADVRLFPTIVRFDAVYATLFKCSNVRVADLPCVSGFMKDVYALPGVRETVDLAGYRSSYFGQLFPLNPGGIVPIGPTEADLGLGEDANRGTGDVFHRR